MMEWLMKKAWILTLALLLPLTAAAEATVEAQVRQAVADFNTSYAANDLDRYFAFYDDTATLIFGQQRSTVADYRASWHELIAGGGGVEKNVVSDVQVRLLSGGEAAAATYRIEVHTRSASGEVTPEQAVETDVWVRQDGAWRILSLHYSPVPMGD
jgi:uncharacterized protein (TIGR02246 family)